MRNEVKCAIWAECYLAFRLTFAHIPNCKLSERRHTVLSFYFEAMVRVRCFRQRITAFGRKLCTDRISSELPMVIIERCHRDDPDL